MSNEEIIEGNKQYFQDEVNKWMIACFGDTIKNDRVERNFRFLEEAIELVQSNGCNRENAHHLVDYVFDRPTGEIRQECGGVMVTLAALASAAGIDMENCGSDELKRIWTKIDQIRSKQAAKKIKSGPLP
jgi:hypothetical protein